MKWSFFRKKLSGHCLYDFWFALLENTNAWERMFNSDNLVPKQTLSLAFQFAIVHGYYELVTFIWNNITDSQREFIGIFLFWKKKFTLTDSWTTNMKDSKVKKGKLAAYRITAVAKSMFQSKRSGSVAFFVWTTLYNQCN